MKLKSLSVTIGSVLGILLLIAGAGAFFIYFVTELPVVERDRALFNDAMSFKRFTGNQTYKINPAFEKYEKLRYIDGSHELQYTYEHPTRQPPYIFSGVTAEPNIIDAKATYTAEWIGMKVGLSLDGSITTAPLGSLELGDESKVSHINNQSGFGVGSLLMVRVNNKIYSMLIIGWQFTKSELRSLLTEKIEKTRKWTP